MTRTIITGCLMAAGLLLAACETAPMASGKPPVQPEQNTAHHMHYPAPGN